VRNSETSISMADNPRATIMQLAHCMTQQIAGMNTVGYGAARGDWRLGYVDL